ncbi:hypothetical protein MK079_01915 [Candidatus Gracilibacteria bacterium]|nr:hypothetical protein [Candidatus Gracilibacteria bacterium]
MIDIKQVLISEKLIDYIKQRGLSRQYQKVQKFILSGEYKLVDLRIRHPKSQKVYYFRLNKQFRCLGRLDGDTLKIYHIDNHQN